MSAKSPTIILTGASRGLGHSIAHILLNHRSKPNLVLTARTAGPLTSFEAQYPDRVAYISGDITSPRIEADLINLAVQKFGSLDGLIINHGILGPVRRIGDLHQNKGAREDEAGGRSEDDIRYWEDSKVCWDVNYFSALRLSAEALPHLKKSEFGGKIIFVSSGAATTGYVSILHRSRFAY
jgi:NAD(P)-dependent dehydrogenase (short-subunit alcohol dehydrogenase family)